MTPDTLLDIAASLPANATLLATLPELGLPQAHLTAGCLFQPVWNHRSGREPSWGIKDFDVFYFDSSDLSWEAENAVIERANALLGPLAPQVEIRNQARVHLWYEQRFGRAIAPLTSARDGIDRFLIPCTSIGVEVATGEVYAPNGLDETWAGILRPNPLLDETELFLAKAESYRSRWPWLTLETGTPHECAPV